MGYETAKAMFAEWRVDTEGRDRATEDGPDFGALLARRRCRGV